MFSPQGPTLRELAVQALSSTERGYDLLAPAFDRTPFRTSERVLAATAEALAPLGPPVTALDLCCGTGAGTGVLRWLGAERVVGVDFSAGMLAVARATEPAPWEPEPVWVRADARRLPFGPEFDLVVSFGAFGHFLPREWPVLFGQVSAVLAPGGVFAFPIAAPPPVGSRTYLTLAGFDAAMRLRNALWRPRFVMYYRPFQLSAVRAALERAGFGVSTLPLTGLGARPDGSPRCRLVLARRAD
ncbi:class I SAM-dependent methyltransferase [Streptacidiphilus sp. 4-A2]|nr:class I SAM-dependent methyltransferase [Streptacidiphilus sp. 4-A2]